MPSAKPSAKPVAAVVDTAAKPADKPTSTTGHVFQTRSDNSAKRITSERIAADLAAFSSAGGHIEVLGITRVEFKKKEDRAHGSHAATPPVPPKK